MTSDLLKQVGICRFLITKSVALLASWISRGPIGAVPAAAQQDPGLVPVTGTLFVGAFVSDAAVTELEIPDATVTLVDPSGGVVDESTTALDGRFRLEAKPDATYEICWEIQGQSGCATRVKVGRDAVWAGRVIARVKGPYVFGTVLTGDARPCWVQDSFFDLDVSTEVQGGGKTTRANIQGEYLLLVPANATFRVGARCELAEAGQVITASAPRQRLDLNFGNRAPRITSVAATDGTRFLTRAPMGQTLKVATTNRELDGDTVEFAWKLADGQVGALTGSTTDTEEWQLANADGRQSLYLMARDGRGGFAFERFDLQVGDDRIDVSGRAVDEVTGLPIRNATASLGGASVRTNDQGWFSLSTTPVQDDRYVLNIEHPNFALGVRSRDEVVRVDLEG
jgi:hypothetical protein